MPNLVREEEESLNRPIFNITSLKNSRRIKDKKSNYKSTKKKAERNILRVLGRERPCPSCHAGDSHHSVVS